MAAEQILQLDPSKVVAEGNIRYGLKAYRVADLAESIANLGGVQVPVLVQANGKGSYKLVDGFYRHAAVEKLNKDGAGLKLPAVLVTVADETERVKRQISANMDRENMSPIDIAVAAHKLLDAGVPRPEVLKVFRRPGGRKGLAMQDASPAWLRMMLSFLNFPKKVQNMIHEGTLPVSAAYQLSRLPEAEWERVLERAEKDRQAEIDREERENDKLTKEEEKVNADATKLAELTTARDAAAAALALEATKVEAATTAATEAAKVPENFLLLEPDVKKAIAEKLGAAKADLRGAEKARDAAQKELDKAQKALDAVANPQPKADKAETTEPAKVAKPAKKAVVSEGDVKKAAKAEGVKPKKVTPLTLSEIRADVAELVKDKNKLVKTVGAVMSAWLDGSKTVTDVASVIEGLCKK